MNLNVLKKPKLMALGLPVVLMSQCGPQQCAPIAPAPTPVETIAPPVESGEHVTVPVGNAQYDVSTEIECGVSGPRIWFDNVGKKPVDLSLSVVPGRETLQPGGSTMWSWTDSWTAYAPGTNTVVDSGTMSNPC